MRSRLFVLALVLLAAAMGCRDLVQPDPPPPPELFVRGSLRDPRGIVMPAAELRITNTRYVATEDRLEWEGTTDKSGVFQTDLPAPGYYDVRVDRASYHWLSYHEFQAVYFEGSHVTLAYPSESQLARIRVPEGAPPLDPDVGDLSFSRRIELPLSGGTTTESIDARVGADGLLMAFLPPDRYKALVRYSEPGLYFSYSFPDSLDLPVDSLLVFEVPLEPVELLLTLQGGAPPLALFDFKIGALYSYGVRTTFTPSGVVNTIWTLSDGVEQISIEPDSGLPFLTQSTWFDFSGDASISIELGAHRVELHVEAASGAPVLAADVRVDDGAGYRTLSVDGEGRIVWFLNPADYLITVSQPGFESHRDLLTVDRDLAVTYVLTPEEP